VRDSYLLEITVDTLDRALAAERGGAHRIELCSDLSNGGLTPGVELMQLTREQVRLPIFAMIRPRAGDYVYSGAEFALMQRDIGASTEVGVDGVALGILTGNGRVDVARTRELVEQARPLPVTFHRAFDISRDLRKSLEDVIQTGATRILTSGGAMDAIEGRAQLAKLVQQARGRVIIVPGAGITAANVGLVASETGAGEFHAGLSSIVIGADRNDNRFEAEVRELRKSLETWSRLADNTLRSERKSVNQT
jgi:copper homeostasis protein